LWQWFCDRDGNPLVVLPTGAGKSLVIAEWCKLVFNTDPGACILVVTHVRELVSQNAAELVGLWPEAPWGVYSAGLNRRDIGAALMFASIQSIHKKAFKLPRRVDMVLIDEAHLVSPTDTTMYRKFLADLKTINPALKIIGMTATPFRLDSGRLHEGEGAMFDGIAHETGVRELIDDGYLTPPVTRPRQTADAQISVAGVGTRGGEFIAAQLESAALDPDVVDAIANRIVAAGQDRKGWLIFGCTVKHCEALAEALNARGYAGRGVFGDTDQNEGKGTRDRVIADFKAQRLRFLVSQGVLTTGFNARHVDLIALARPTKSTGLYVQMIGRGTRLAPGKDDCLVLDFGGNIARHGPFDDPWIPEKKGKGEGTAPYKECPECETACATMTRICPSCGFEFPPPERVVDIIPAQKAILSVEPEWLDVAEANYRRHEKAGSPPSMRAEYRVGMTYQREWICFEHQGYARTKAESWWLRRAAAPVPRTVDEAIARAAEIAVPSHIRVKRSGKYDEITAFKFEPPANQERNIAA
jgi:DNA repair protein RadD